MIHLLYRTARQQAITEVLLADASFATEVYFLEDDYSLGTIQDIDQSGADRNAFWQALEPYMSVKDATVQHPYQADQKLLQQIEKALQANTDQQICIWFANNAPETCAYLRILWYFKNYAEQIRQIHIDNLPFFSPEGRIFFPKQIAEIELHELLKCKQLLRQPSLAEIEIDVAEWDTLKEVSSDIRILKSPKLLESAAMDTTLDLYIKQFFQLHPKTAKVARVVKDIHKKYGNYADAVVLARIDRLVQSGALQWHGERAKHFVDCDIALPQVVSDTKTS